MKKISKKRFDTRVLVFCALFAALSALLARPLSIKPNETTRYSLEAFPLFLAGMFFGPIPGALVGFVADFVGCIVFSEFGYNPIYCLPPIIYGAFGGVFRDFLNKKFTFVRLLVAMMTPVILGSVLIQSGVMAYMKYGVENFLLSYWACLIERSIQFVILGPLQVIITFYMIKSNIFKIAGLWPLKKERKPTMTAEQAIEYIHSVFWKGSIPGLGRTQMLLAKMGNPEKKLKFVHIAGTNGKGSTAAMTASILQKAGYRTGLYTSPYIYRFNERMQVNGQQIEDEELCRITEFVKPLADSMEESPTEFELVSCIAFEYFLRQKCDIVVLEVGMGGALDSTNVIEVPEVAVITNIGLDHTEVLGDTVEKIAETKSGIFKENGHAVVYRSTPSVEAVYEKICEEKNVKLHKADFDSLKLKSHDLFGQVFDCGQRKDLELPLLGDHQLHNASVVLSVVDALIEKGWNITEDHIREGLRDVSWPGRFDIVSRDPLFIIDGGHNPQCIEALVKNIQDYLQDKNVIALTGVLADKDYGEMYRPVMPLVKEFVCVTPPNPRKLEAAELAEHLHRAGAQATACESIEEGVRTAIALAGENGVVLCFGSLYSIGSIRDSLYEVLGK